MIKENMEYLKLKLGLIIFLEGLKGKNLRLGNYPGSETREKFPEILIGSFILIYFLYFLIFSKNVFQ
jgi:hypothetical protein